MRNTECSLLFFTEKCETKWKKRNKSLKIVGKEKKKRRKTSEISWRLGLNSIPALQRKVPAIELRSRFFRLQRCKWIDWLSSVLTQHPPTSGLPPHEGLLMLRIKGWSNSYALDDSEEPLHEVAEIKTVLKCKWSKQMSNGCKVNVNSYPAPCHIAQI